MIVLSTAACGVDGPRRSPDRAVGALPAFDSPVETVAVERLDLSVPLEVQVVAVDTTTATIDAPEPGSVLSILVEPGTVVEAGTELAILRVVPDELTLLELEILDRRVRIAEISGAPDLAAELAAERDALVEAAAPTIVLTAPLAGVVQRAAAPTGTVVAAGDPVIAIGTSDTVLLAGTVPSSWTPHLEVGLGAVLDLGAGSTASGEVVVLEEATNGPTVIAIRPDPAEATIAIGRRLDATLDVGVGERLIVPVGAVRGTETPFVVVVASDGSTERRSVEIAAVLGPYAEIADGLVAGDEVILP